MPFAPGRAQKAGTAFRAWPQSLYTYLCQYRCMGQVSAVSAFRWIWNLSLTNAGWALVQNEARTDSTSMAAVIYLVRCVGQHALCTCGWDSIIRAYLNHYTIILHSSLLHHCDYITHVTIIMLHVSLLSSHHYIYIERERYYRVCMYMFIYIYIYIYTTYMFICIICVYIYIHTYMCIYVYIYIYTRTDVCMHVCMYACMHVCMYACM